MSFWGSDIAGVYPCTGFFNHGLQDFKDYTDGLLYSTRTSFSARPSLIFPLPCNPNYPCNPW